MSIFRALTLMFLLAALVAGCATRFRQPDPAAPHAVLALPSQAAQRDRRMFFEPLECNGLARPRNWLLQSLRIPPGEFHLLARAANEARQGSCLLQFMAVAGRTYLLDGGLEGGRFTLLVRGDEEVVARCSAPATALPTPARIPGAPSR